MKKTVFTGVAMLTALGLALPAASAEAAEIPAPPARKACPAVTGTALTGAPARPCDVNVELKKKKKTNNKKKKKAKGGRHYPGDGHQHGYVASAAGPAA